MGNTHGHRTVTRQSTSSDLSSQPGKSTSTPDVEPRIYCSQSSIESSAELNNNHHHHYKIDVATSVEFAPTIGGKRPMMTIMPLKSRKVSRAASSGRLRTRRTALPAMISSIGGNLANSKCGSDVLADESKALVQGAWAALLNAQQNDLTRIGLGIYARIFRAAPELREVFGIPDSAAADVSAHVPFHRSASLFVSLLNLCVRNIYALESEMGPVLVMYGRRHYHRESIGFRMCYLPLFAQSIIEYLREQFGNIAGLVDPDACITAWKLLLVYVTSKMAEGVEVERMRANHHGRRRSIF